MTDVPVATQAITPELVRTAVCMLGCRFGTLEAEADRRGRVRALLRSSRALALALDQFATKAAPHSRGEHSTAGMHAEADAMARALEDWTFAVAASAQTYVVCHGADAHRGGAASGAPLPAPVQPLTGV